MHEAIERWADQWQVPPESALRLREELCRGLYDTFNNSRTIGKTGRILVLPHKISSPGWTGQYLLQQMGTDLTPLPEELQRLITHTSCQHRIERFGGSGEIPALYYYDGRLMYGGCCQGLGIAGGKYRHSEGEDILPDERGRARVHFSAPVFWQGVGLLAVKDPQGEGWFWPTDYCHGDRYETWADLAEIRWARQQGWEVRVKEKLTWPEARPLDLWAERLSRLYLQARRHRRDDLAGCYRAILLQTIGRFHNIGYRDERSVVPRDDPRATFEAVEHIDPEGAHIVERVRFAKDPSAAHPEWSAAIWSKVHVRLAKALLNVSRETTPLIAIRGDAIYSAGPIDIEDTGAVGQFRLKAHVPGPLPYPQSWAEIRALTNG